MSLIPVLTIALLAYMIPVSLGMLLLLGLFKKHVGVDLLMVWFMPICAWLVLLLLNSKGKTLTNLVCEPALLGVLIAALTLVGCFVPEAGGPNRWGLGIVTVMLSVLFTLGIFFLMPSLPE